MILVQLTINGTIHYLSDDYLELTHLYEAKVAKVNPVSYATRSEAGGYVEPQFGDIEFLPDTFSDDWPPPKSCVIKISITDTTEEAAVEIFTGRAHRTAITRESVKYDLFGKSYSNAITATTWIDDTLSAVFTTYCGASYLNLTLNTDYARATSPSVYREIEADTLIIDMLSDFAEATHHLFYISGTTLYLVDMLLDNGTDLEVDEFDFFPVEYSDAQPYRRFMTEAVRKYSLASSYGYGSEIDDSDIASNVEHFFLRVGDNSGNDMAYIFHVDVIPYETGKTYMTKVKVRRPSGTGTFYCGLLGIASDRLTIVDRNGGTNYTLPCYHTSANPDLSSYTSAWLTKTGYSSGWANPGTHAAAPNVGSPGTLYDNGAGTKAEYFRPVILCNYNGATGRTDIDFFAVYEVDGSGNILEEILYDDFTGGLKWFDQSRAGGNRDLATSIAASASAMATHLGNRKTIFESPKATISLPLTAANIAIPGQKISWTDESVVPDATNYLNVTAYIRVRTIKFDMTSYKITYEGEGGIA